MTTTTMTQSRGISLKIFQPILISGFTVMVLATSFMVGKHVGFNEGMEYSQVAQTSTPTMAAASELEE